MRSLGICWIFYGAWRLLAGAAMMIWSGTATVMFGALLTRVADPFSLMAMFHVLYVGLILLSAFCGVLGILAGIALLGRGENARSIAVIAALFSLPDLPLGVVLGGYTLYAFAQTPARRTQAH